MQSTSDQIAMRFGDEKNRWQLRKIGEEWWFVSETSESVGVKFQIRVHDCGMHGLLLQAFAAELKRPNPSETEKFWQNFTASVDDLLTQPADPVKTIARAREFIRLALDVRQRGFTRYIPNLDKENSNVEPQRGGQS